MWGSAFCTEPSFSPYPGQCPPETSKARRDTQSNELIEINPQTEGKVYTRCFCLEEPQNSKVGGRDRRTWAQASKVRLPSPDLTEVCPRVSCAWCREGTESPAYLCTVPIGFKKAERQLTG